MSWWHETVVYQVYPRSFMDSNADGVGDLAGLISRLDYLSELGVETLWISPFYQSPQADAGYDISDYRSIAPEQGDMETCDRLIDEVHRRGMRIVFDMVLNHTSDQHPWFLASRSSRDDPKRDWYIWRDGRRPGGAAPPNNWRSMVGGSGWHYDASTDQWYWAQFLPFQPDLNYRNPAVRAEMLDTMRFWLDRGVDGFRLDIVNALFEDEELRDNPFGWTLLPSDDDPSMLFQRLDRTLNHPDTLAFMKTLRYVMNAYTTPERFLVGEVNAPLDLARAHCGAPGAGEGDEGLHLVFLFRSLTVPLQARALRDLITTYERLFPPPLLPTWVFSNHDRTRRISRLGGDLERAKLNMALQLTLRGVPFLYYGEEIGMLQRRIPVRESRDPIAQRLRRTPQILVDGLRALRHESLNRDECRTPMQWEPTPHVGFCPDDVRPWLPPPEDSRGRTVAEQRDDPHSLLHCTRRFLDARRAHPALHRGDMTLLPEAQTGRHILGYRRQADDRVATVLLNMSSRPQRAPATTPAARLLVSTDVDRRDAPGETLTLAPWEGVVLVNEA